MADTDEQTPPNKEDDQNAVENTEDNKDAQGNEEGSTDGDAKTDTESKDEGSGDDTNEQDKEDQTGSELVPMEDHDEFAIEDNIWRDDDFITQPNARSETPAPKTIITPPEVGKGNVKEPSASDLFGKDIESGKIPDVNAKYVKVEDGVTRIIDMTEVMNNISKNAVLDRDSAVAIESHFNGFITDTNPLNMYTNVPMATGYSKAIRHMKYRMTLEEEQLQKDANSYITCIADDVMLLAEKVHNEIMPDLIMSIRDIQLGSGKYVSKIFEERETLPMLNEKGEEVDVSILDIEKPRFYKLNIPNDHIDAFNKTLNAMVSYLKSKELAHFLFMHPDEKQLKDLDSKNEPEYLRLDTAIDGLYINYMTIMSELDLYRIYGFIYTDTFNKCVDSLKYIYTNVSKEFAALSDATGDFNLPDGGLDFMKLNTFVTDNAEKIRLLNGKLNYANKVISDLPHFMAISEELITHLKFIYL